MSQMSEDISMAAADQLSGSSGLELRALSIMLCSSLNLSIIEMISALRFAALVLSKCSTFAISTSGMRVCRFES